MCFWSLWSGLIIACIVRQSKLTVRTLVRVKLRNKALFVSCIVCGQVIGLGAMLVYAKNGGSLRIM